VIKKFTTENTEDTEIILEEREEKNILE